MKGNTLTDLDKLIAAVEGGTADDFGSVNLGLPIYRGYAESAYNGSLDAAKALHEALLPGWIGYADTSGFCFMYEDEKEWNERSAIVPGNPARAWLIATLKAYRSLK